MMNSSSFQTIRHFEPFGIHFYICMYMPTRQKSTEVEHPVSELIKNRRSIRAFKPGSVEADKIYSLFEATRWAPSSTNEQPWVYLYATKEQTELWNKMIEPLNEGNKVWVKEAPLLILSLARKTFVRNGFPNFYAMYDLGGANSLLSLQAVTLGLQVRQMAGFNRDSAKALLNIPDEFELGVFMAVGYPGDPESLPESVKAKELAPRIRFLQQEFVRNSAF
jgi:nitroreductase